MVAAGQGSQHEASYGGENNYMATNLGENITNIEVSQAPKPV